MVQVTKVKRVPKVKVGEELIHSNNWCGRCLYNIPKGTFLLLLPSLTLLLIGVITLVLDWDANWREGLYHIGIIFLALGGGLSLVNTFFCIRTWCRRQPDRSPSPEEVAARRNQQPVQLNVYRVQSADQPIYSLPHDV